MGVHIPPFVSWIILGLAGIFAIFDIIGHLVVEGIIASDLLSYYVCIASNADNTDPAIFAVMSVVISVFTALALLFVVIQLFNLICKNISECLLITIYTCILDS